MQPPQGKKRVAEEIREEVATALHLNPLKRHRHDANVAFPELERQRALLNARLSHNETHCVKMTAFIQQRQQREKERATTCIQITHCIICLEGMNSGETVLEALPCGHVFHTDCIRKWANYKSHCPIDRSPFDGILI